MDQDATWYVTEVNVGLGDVVLDGVAAHPKRGTPPPFSVHVCCGQMAGWMNTPLGMEALDGVPALRERGTKKRFSKNRSKPNVSVRTQYKNGSGHYHLFGNFSSINDVLYKFLLWLRSPISATAELLSDMLPCISPIIRPITF